MSAVIICADDDGDTSVRWPRDQYGVAVPVRRVRVVEVAERGHVPADVIAYLHGHHGRVAVDVSVDGPLDVGVGKAGAGDGAEDAGGSDGLEFVAIEF